MFSCTRMLSRKRRFCRKVLCFLLILALFLICSSCVLVLSYNESALSDETRSHITMQRSEDWVSNNPAHVHLPLHPYRRNDHQRWRQHKAIYPQSSTVPRVTSSVSLSNPDLAPLKDGKRSRFSEEGDVPEDHGVEDVVAIERYTAGNVESFTGFTHPDDQIEVRRPEPQSTDEEHHLETVEFLQDAVNSTPEKPPKEHLSLSIDSSKTAGLPTDSVRLPIEPLKDMYPWSQRYTFPDPDECLVVKEKADDLPDLLHVPFEQSVQDVVLDGWEDEWIAKARYRGPRLQEPKIDFVYNCLCNPQFNLRFLLKQTGVNGSQAELQRTMRPYELNSSLNDPEGVWLVSHGTNRYREWDELRYSIRSVEKYAASFTNRIQILVNAFQVFSDIDQAPTMGKQRPQWLKDESEKVQILSQEEFFGPEERKCLPSFDSLTIENQLFNTKSETDRLFALSDDMLLGKRHAAADLYSPLFGPTLGFKDNAYNTLKPPTDSDAERFGEKPFLIYTSWLLNRRFGTRKRKGQAHFGHSLSRSVAREAITSFPRPALRSAAQRFRGETGFQLYSWYVMFHYTMERHREALLWSYVMLRSDQNDDGYLDWTERKKILHELAEGMGNESPEQFRARMYYRVADHHKQAGLEPPRVNTEVVWTSLDGPMMIKGLDCDAFDTEDCLAPGFSIEASDSVARNPVFSSAAIFDRVARESPRCGDCLLKLILNRRRSGLGTLLPHPTKKPQQRTTVVKALMKFQYTVVSPDAYFYMVTDVEQVEHTLLKPYIKHNKKAGQICLNDDVTTEDEAELEKLRNVMLEFFEGLFPEPSSYENRE